ncbi:hypothetical protein ACUUL3_16395 [Thiovibrio sp. JS02]
MLEPDSQSALAPMDTTLNLDTSFTMSGVPVYSAYRPGAVTYTETGTVGSIMVNMAMDRTEPDTFLPKAK